MIDVPPSISKFLMVRNLKMALSVSCAIHSIYIIIHLIPESIDVFLIFVIAYHGLSVSAIQPTHQTMQNVHNQHVTMQQQTSVSLNYYL